MGVPLLSSISRWDFPYQKPSILGTSIYLWNPPQPWKPPATGPAARLSPQVSRGRAGPRGEWHGMVAGVAFTQASARLGIGIFCSSNFLELEAQMGLSRAMGVPQKWMIYVREHPTKIWMMTGGSSFFKETPKYSQQPPSEENSPKLGFKPQNPQMVQSRTGNRLGTVPGSSQES